MNMSTPAALAVFTKDILFLLALSHSDIFAYPNFADFTDDTLSLKCGHTDCGLGQNKTPTQSLHFKEHVPET